MPTPRTCVVDNSKYNYCPKCGHDDPMESWRRNFCSENCREIYNVSSSYVRKMLTANEAKQLLNGLDISKLNNFNTSYKNTISDIMFNAVSETIVEPKVQTIEVADEVSEIVLNETDVKDDIATDVAAELSESDIEEADSKKKKRKRFY